MVIGNKQFEFVQEDPIFELFHSPFLTELGLSIEGGDEATFKKKLQTLYPEKLPSCFCCGKDVSGTTS
jgi:hypothetical protein